MAAPNPFKAVPTLTPRRAWKALLVGLLLVSLAPAAIPGPVSAQAGGAGVEYRLIVTCPQGGVVDFNSATPTTGCPVRAVDGQDQMGDPSIAVDPFQPENLIIASLHGATYNGADGGVGDFVVTSCPQEGPTPKSRCGQAFTTFVSDDAGRSWFDNPFVPPSDLGGNAMGETTAITIDPYGHVFVGSLYSMPAGGSSHSYVVVAQKFQDIDNINSNQDGEYHAEYLTPVYEGNAIHNLWFLFDPIKDNMTMVWTETVAELPPAAIVCNTDGNATAVGGAYVHRDGSVWRETNGVADLQTDLSCPSNPDGRTLSQGVPFQSNRAMAGVADPGNGTTPPSNATSPPSNGTAPPGNATLPGIVGRQHSVIGVLWTGIAVNSTYNYQRLEDTIGPCSSSTNPVLSDGYLYIGCVAAPQEGLFRWNPTTIPGTVELFRMDPSGGTPTYLGASPVIGGSPRLGVRSDGRLALISADVSEDGQLRVMAAFGHYKERQRETPKGTEVIKGIEWSALGSYGDKIAPVDPAYAVVAANVQDLIYREYSGVVHMVLKTKVQRTGISVGVPETPLTPHLRKTLVALDETYGVVYTHGLDIGNLANRTSDPDLMQAPEAAYDDIKDDFLQLPPGNFTYYDEETGTTIELGDVYQREFFAVGDYGQVIFAEVIEVTNLRGPAFAPPGNVPPGIPAPATASSLTQVLVPAAGITAAGLIAGSFFVNRKKDVAASIAKGGK